MLVRHVNCRISAYLRAAFPDARWEWETPSPARLILRGGVGRIKLHGVPDYNYAEVTISPTGSIRCALVRLDPFPAGEASEEEAPAPDEQFNPQVWFEVQGRDVLERLIADLKSRGHNSLSMNEDGTIVVEDEDNGKPFPAFSTFPRKVHWDQTVKVLEREGYAASVDGDAITVYW